MSVSQHPIALRLERQVGEGTTLLATVMGLPLVDGIFPALLLAGAMDGALGILEVGLLVFGGSATVAVVLAEMGGTWRQQVTAVLAVGVLVVAVAAVEAVLDLATFERFAALVILAVAAKTASATVGDYLPRPGVIVGLGLVASLDPANASVALVADPTVVARGVAAASVGAAFALVVALLGPPLRGNVDLDRFRFGSAVALGVLALSVLGVIPSNAPVALAVLGVTALLAFDPGVSAESLADAAADAVADGGEAVPGDGPAADLAGDADDEDPSQGRPGLSDGDRAPWL